MSLLKPHSFYFSTEINTADKILPTANNMQLPNFDRTDIHTVTEHTLHVVQTKRKLLSLRMHEFCVAALQVFSRH
jgi:hypothetical protein